MDNKLEAALQEKVCECGYVGEFNIEKLKTGHFKIKRTGTLGGKNTARRIVIDTNREPYCPACGGKIKVVDSEC